MKFTQMGYDKIQVLRSKSEVPAIIEQIVDSGFQEEPFYVCDIGDIVKKHRNWKHYLPRVHPFYAVKCNDSPEVLKVLAALGTGFDCASKMEISKILGLGVEPNRIIFANPAKSPSHITFANLNNVKTMTFDSKYELYKVKKFYSNAKMVIRIRSDASGAKLNLGVKFGCDPDIEAPYLLEVAKKLNIDVVGVSFHVGSGCYEPEAYTIAIEKARKVFDMAFNKYGFKFNLLDIGGGFPGEKDTNIKHFADQINSALDNHFPSSLNTDIEIIAEPGRYYVSSAYTLACNIHSIKDLKNDERTTVRHKMYYINDGTYGSFNIMIFYDLQKVIPIPLKGNVERKMISSSFWGPTCDGIDILVENVMFPQLNLGEWVIFENMGAYTIPLCTQFNGFPHPQVYAVVDQTLWKNLKDLFPFQKDDFIFYESESADQKEIVYNVGMLKQY